MRIVVLDCYSRMGLAVVNALDRSYELIGGSASRNGRHSSAVDRRLRSPRLAEIFRYPPANTNEAGFRNALLEACRTYDVDAIFPASTASAHALARMKHDLGAAMPARVVIDDIERVRQLADKWRLYELCTRVGVPTPRTFLPGEAGFEDVADLGLPCVVKPRLSEASRGVRFAETSEEVSSILASPACVGAVPEEGHRYVVQELISGSIANVGGCFVRGRPVALMTQRRILTRYEFGGPGIVHRTTYEPEIMGYAKQLLADIEWTGPVLLEFLCTDDGRYFLIDANPRVWSSTDMTVAAGMNVCQQAVDIFVLERDPDPVTEYQVGLTMRWLSPPAAALCFRQPRTFNAVGSRLSALLAPARPGRTITNLRRGNFRHLAGMAVNSSRSRG